MPVYNTAKYLKEAVDSILAQTFGDFEFIILDDCSPDNSQEILNEYTDSRIIRYRGERNVGLANILNIGIGMARGEYIARMDSDDLSFPERLRIQVDYLDTHPEVDLCSCGMKLFGRKDDVWIRENDSESVKLTALFYSPVLHASSMWRKREFEQHHLRYDQSMVPSEDYDLWTRSLLCGLELVNIPEVLYSYRIRQSQATENTKLISEKQRRIKEYYFQKTFGEDCGHLIENLADENFSIVHSAIKRLIVLNRRNGFFNSRLFRRKMMLLYQSSVWSSLSKRFSLFTLVHLSFKNFVKYLFISCPESWKSGKSVPNKTIGEAPRITVVMPVFNGEKFIREAIESVLAQTYRNFVFLIINDGSTDASMSIVNDFEDDRIKIIENDGNQGLVKSLNKAFSDIDTEFIARMDCDDIWYPEKLSRQVALLDKQPGIGVCGTCALCFGDKNYIQKFPETNEQIKVGLLFHCMMCHPSVVFRTSVLKSSGLEYEESFYPAEDYRMWIRAVGVTQLYNLQEVLIKYRTHHSQVSNLMWDIQEQTVDRIRESQLRDLYPDCPSEDVLFHIKRFASLRLSSEKDIIRFRRWVETLLLKNRKSKYIDSRIITKELGNYVYAATKEYFQMTQTKYGVTAVIAFLLSAKWRYLDLRRIISHIRYLLSTHSG